MLARSASGQSEITGQVLQEYIIFFKALNALRRFTYGEYLNFINSTARVSLNRRKPNQATSMLSEAGLINECIRLADGLVHRNLRAATPRDCGEIIETPMNILYNS